MRYLFFPVLFLTAAIGYGQSASWCGTVLPESFKAEYAAKDRSNYEQLIGQRAAMRYVPVYYHIVAKSDGTGGAGLKRIFESHCELNQAYNQFDIAFYIAGIDTVMNTALWNYQNQSLGYQAFNQNNEPNVCNIYVNGNLPGLCGFATFPNSAPNGGGIFLNSACMGSGTTTLPHEMGHYLGLLHTFDTSYGIEYVDGSNCSTKGDRFCDTPADFVDFRAPCPYTGDSTDPHGDLYRTVIDETLYMSYFNDNCTNKFSPMQQVEMNGTLSGSRSNLLNQTLPDLSALPTATFVQPADGDTTLIGGVSQTFIWNSIPGAVYYKFILQNPTSSIQFADTLIADTTFTFGNIASNKSYKYKVQGLSYGNTCSSFTPYQNISTSGIKASVSVTSPSCFGETDAHITITPSNGTAPYTLEWSTGTTGNSINNLAPGIYEVTITDADNEVATAQIPVVDPAPVSVAINRVGVNLNASGNGGTPPYTFAWSNGINGPYNNNVPYGSYTVSVTDSKGCSNTETFSYTSIGIDPELKASIKLFPNPAEHSTILNVQFDLNEPTKAVVAIINMAGSVITQEMKTFESGTNLLQFPIGNLASGVYLLRFKANEAVQSERFTVIR